MVCVKSHARARTFCILSALLARLMQSAHTRATAYGTRPAAFGWFYTYSTDVSWPNQIFGPNRRSRIRFPTGTGQSCRVRLADPDSSEMWPYAGMSGEAWFLGALSVTHRPSMRISKLCFNPGWGPGPYSMSPGHRLRAGGRSVGRSDLIRVIFGTGGESRAPTMISQEPNKVEPSGPADAERQWPWPQAGGTSSAWARQAASTDAAKACESEQCDHIETIVWFGPFAMPRIPLQRLPSESKSSVTESSQGRLLMQATQWLQFDAGYSVATINNTNGYSRTYVIQYCIIINVITIRIALLNKQRSPLNCKFKRKM